MYIFKNAVKNIIRNKGRNILIGIIIVVIATASCVTLAIRQSASKIIKSYEETNQIEATIGMDRQNLMNTLNGKDEDSDDSDSSTSQEDMIEAFNNIKSPTLDEIKNYGDSEYVSSYYYTYELSMDADDLTEATDSLVKETTETTTDTTTKKFSGGSQSGRPGMPPEGSGYKTTTSTTKKTTEKIYNEKAANGAFTLVGYNSYESMSDFISGNYTIKEGEVSSDFTSNSVVISEELATLNDLEVGDTITLVNPENTKKTYEVTITGIYTENTDSSSDMSKMFSNSANKIITNSTLVETILADDDDLTATITPTFIIKDEDSIEKFTAEVTEKGLSEYYTVTTNIDEIKSATESVTNVKTFATTFLIITLVIGGVVLVVINMINIRERKYEIGVLRTIGMKKSKLAFQFITELAIVSLIGLALGAVIGSFTSVPVANKLLANEISTAETKTDDISQNFGGHGDNENFKNGNFNVAKVEEVSSINAVVDFKVLASLLGLGLLLTLLSSTASMVAIARFSPLTILKERS